MPITLPSENAPLTAFLLWPDRNGAALEPDNERLIAVLFVLISTGMGQNAGLFLWCVLASIEWLADRYAGWLSKTLSKAQISIDVAQTDAVASVAR